MKAKKFISNLNFEMILCNAKFNEQYKEREKGRQREAENKKKRDSGQYRTISRASKLDQSNSSIFHPHFTSLFQTHSFTHLTFQFLLNEFNELLI
jgi:hypothetical protein